jgi:hypothetical protein
MKPRMAVVFLVLSGMIVTAFVPTDALAWGSVTHAYFATELGYRWGYLNLQEVYGSSLPDMFNLMYGSPYRDYLWTQTHVEFMKYVNYCTRRSTKASGAGFASHNDVWGADYTAHHSAITNPGEGYVITKVNSLAPALVPQLVEILTAAGVPNAHALALQLAPGLAENFVETAVDVLIRRNEDAGAGFRLALAAQLRDPGIPFVLTRAYAKDLAQEFGISILEAAFVIVGTEIEYRNLMKLYGGIFTKSEDETIVLLAEQGATLAQMYLKAETGYDVVVPAEALVAFLRDVAIPLVEPDYGAEIAATLAYLEEEMDNHGFSSHSIFLAIGSERESDTPDDGIGRVPTIQNHPNPFRGETEIRYSLPEKTFIDLSIYSVEGRLIAALINREVAAGSHNARWEAKDLYGNPVAPGLYFLRFQAGESTETRRLILLK